MPIIIMDNTQLPEEKPVKGKDARRYTSERDGGVTDPNFEHPAESLIPEPSVSISGDDLCKICEHARKHHIEYGCTVLGCNCRKFTFQDKGVTK